MRNGGETDKWGENQMKIDVQDETKLRWPPGWDRTLIELRKAAPQWKKTADQYKALVVKELTLLRHPVGDRRGVQAQPSRADQ